MTAKPYSETKPTPPCAHDSCRLPFLCSIILKTGRTNLCRKHYDQYWQIMADRANRDKGLDTVDKMRGYCKELLGMPARPPGNWWAKEVLANAKTGHPTTLFAFELAQSALAGEGQRQPGEDDE